MDWATTIRQEGETSSILRTDHLATTHKIKPIAVTQALARQERRGLVEHIGKKIYFNWLASARYNIADPEKALLDFVYFALQSGIEPPFDELELNHLSRKKLLDYSKRFPSTVNNSLVRVLATRSTAA